MADVSLAGVAYRYPGAALPTLEGLDLEIASGEAHALLGGSGAGKTTLLNLLSGLLDVRSGTLRIGGRVVAGRSPAERRVSQVFQFPVLYDAMTVSENLQFPLVNSGIARPERRARAQEIAGRLGVGHTLERRPGTLSLFEKQLVAIGKSLVRRDVALVLLDEPLTAAEPARKWQLRRTLRALQRESGATMIYVTHDQTEALTFADRISVLHQGRILQTGTPQALIDTPRHEYVGYFVGAPGMNVLDTALLGDAATGLLPEGVGPDPDLRLGFRPDWAALTPGAAQRTALPARITGITILGTHRGRRSGIVEALVAGTRLQMRQIVDGLEVGACPLVLRRSVLFRQGWLVDA